MARDRIHPEQHGRDHHGARHHGVFTHMLGHQRQQQPDHGGGHRKRTQDGADDRGRQPRSCPMSGTTKVCTSQQDESTQFTMMRRRNAGSLSRSHERWGGPPGCGNHGRQFFGVAHPEPGGQRQHGQSGKRSAMPLGAARSAACVVNHQPAKNGPMKLDTARPNGQPAEHLSQLGGVVRGAAHMALQRNDGQACGTAVIRAARHITENTGKISESPAPATP